MNLPRPRKASADWASAGELLAVNDLRIEFRTGRGIVRAVRGVSFSLSRGETLAVIGESGSGKSVTARAILGTLQSPPAYLTGGSIQFEEEDLLAVPARRRRALQGDRIAMVFQDALAALNPLFSVGWQIAELFKVHRGFNRSQGYAEAVRLLAKVGIPDAEERVKQYVHQFSGGMRQRVMIALAIALRPDLLLADEPTTALDVTVQAQVMQLLMRLKSETGMALLLITHNIAIAAETADRVAVMYAGRIVEIGPVADVLERPGHPYSRALIALADTSDRADHAPIPGIPPDMIAPPVGCAFHPRCPMARERCRAEDPKLRTVRAEQQAACHFAEEVSR